MDLEQTNYQKNWKAQLRQIIYEVIALLPSNFSTPVIKNVNQIQILNNTNIYIIGINLYYAYYTFLFIIILPLVRTTVT